MDSYTLKNIREENQNNTYFQAPGFILCQQMLLGLMWIHFYFEQWSSAGLKFPFMTMNFIAPTVMTLLTGLVTIALPVALVGTELKGTTFYVMRSTTSATAQVSIPSWSAKASCHLGHSQGLLRRMGQVGT